MASWQDYLKLMRSLSKTLGDLTEVEHDKNAAAARGDLRGVEECMKREQVLSLTLRGYDQKRDSLLRDLGITGVRLSTLVRSCGWRPRPWPKNCAGSTPCSKPPAKWPGIPWSAICGPLSAPRPSRPETRSRQRSSGKTIRQISGPEPR